MKLFILSLIIFFIGLIQYTNAVHNPRIASEATFEDDGEDWSVDIGQLQYFRADGGYIQWRELTTEVDGKTSYVSPPRKNSKERGSFFGDWSKLDSIEFSMRSDGGDYYGKNTPDLNDPTFVGDIRLENSGGGYAQYYIPDDSEGRPKPTTWSTYIVRLRRPVAEANWEFGGGDSSLEEFISFSIVDLKVRIEFGRNADVFGELGYFALVGVLPDQQLPWYAWAGFAALLLACIATPFMRARYRRDQKLHYLAEKAARAEEALKAEFQPPPPGYTVEDPYAAPQTMADELSPTPSYGRYDDTPSSREADHSTSASGSQGSRRKKPRGPGGSQGSKGSRRTKGSNRSRGSNRR